MFKRDAVKTDYDECFVLSIINRSVLNLRQWCPLGLQLMCKTICVRCCHFLKRPSYRTPSPPRPPINLPTYLQPTVLHKTINIFSPQSMSYGWCPASSFCFVLSWRLFPAIEPESRIRTLVYLICQLFSCWSNSCRKVGSLPRSKATKADKADAAALPAPIELSLIFLDFQLPTNLLCARREASKFSILARLRDNVQGWVKTEPRTSPVLRNTERVHTNSIAEWSGLWRASGGKKSGMG